MKAVIYARFNSQKQIENAIADQVSTCEKYAEEKDYTIINKYIDTSSREQFQKMIQDSLSKQFQYVLVYQLDRFSSDIFERVMAEKTLKDNGVQLISVCGELTNSSSEMLLKSIIEKVREINMLELEKKAQKK